MKWRDRKPAQPAPSNAFCPSGRYIITGLRSRIENDMPIYEYRCQQCGHELERIQKMGDERLRDCPACQKPELRRLVSAAAFRLKGSGWYETDFKQGNKRNLADSGNEAPKSSVDSAAGSANSGASNSEASKSDSNQSATKQSPDTKSKPASMGSGEAA